MTVKEVAELMAGKSEHKIRKNVVIKRIPGMVNHCEGFQLWYHNTAVVTWFTWSTYLNSGKYRTKSTKSIINKFTDAGIYQKDYQWFTGDGRIFYDGIAIPHRK